MRWLIGGLYGLLLVFGSGCAGLYPNLSLQAPCTLPPFYMEIDQLPDPAYPERNRTGDQFLLIGVVRDLNTCQPMANATVMFDMANTEGDYDGTQQGTVYTSDLGLFAIWSTRPSSYGGGQPHIHLFVGAEGYGAITTSHDLLDDRLSWGWIDIGMVLEE